MIFSERVIFWLSQSLINADRASSNLVDKGFLIDLEFMDGFASSLWGIVTMRNTVDCGRGLLSLKNRAAHSPTER